MYVLYIFRTYFNTRQRLRIPGVEGKCVHPVTLQHTATHCNTLQHTATHCKTLQHTATRSEGFDSESEES